MTRHGGRVDVASALRQLPRVDDLLVDDRLAAWPRGLARQAVREALDARRAALRAGDAPTSDVLDDAIDLLTRWTSLRARRVLNATGVVVHTNLGRAPWSEAAIAAANEVARHYSNLEVRLQDGARGGRLDGVRDKLRRLTGAEDALAVNNGAAALLLALTALARDRDVVVSRGELVEIGGSFRVPDVVASGGARLVEVGTTNRTRLRDYAAAVTGASAVLLRVHPSNFRMEGFTEETSTEALAALARDRGLVLVHDLGSGTLVRRGSEPSVSEALAQGPHLVTFSADKLLGGPQAGLIVGRRDVVARLRQHPLYRALRLDKTILAALDATLREHLLGIPPPVTRMLDADPAELARRATRLCEAMVEAGLRARVVEVEGRAGGGALPEEGLPGHAVAVSARSPDALAARLRRGDPAVLCRIHQGELLFDPRTVRQDEEIALVARLADAVENG